MNLEQTGKIVLADPAGEGSVRHSPMLGETFQRTDPRNLEQVGKINPQNPAGEDSVSHSPTQGETFQRSTLGETFQRSDPNNPRTILAQGPQPQGHPSPMVPATNASTSPPRKLSLQVEAAPTYEQVTEQRIQ